MTTENIAPATTLEEPAAPRRTRLEEFWRLLRKNSLALAGMVVFALFFATAVIGVFLTSGPKPVFDPSVVRLQEKLRPPLSRSDVASLKPDEIPALGVYLFGTDDLGRDVFARMLQGAWVSLTVGFVAVGISVAIGIFMGAIAGYYGQQHVRLEQVLLSVLLLAGAALLAAGVRRLGAVGLGVGLAWLFFSISPWGFRRLKSPRPWMRFFLKGTIQVDTLIMRFVDIMLCFPSFFLILTVVALLPASIYTIMIVIGLTSSGGHRPFRARGVPLAEGAGFRGGGAGTGGGQFPDHFPAHDPERHCAGARVRHHRHRLGHPDRGRVEFSGVRRAAAPRHLGQHPLRRQALHLRCALADVHPRRGHSARGAGVQPLRRGPARHPEPEVETAELK